MPEVPIDAGVAERIKEAYIRPIRTVLVVDDDFHRYDSAAGKDPERAKSIWLACRKRGYLCDIDDGAELVDAKDPPYLLQSDLVILDYNLRGEESEWSLGLLRRLADSDHASLVVVYTKQREIHEVRRAISAHLRGVRSQAEQFSTEDIRGTWDRVEGSIQFIPTDTLVDAYLRGDSKQYRKDPVLQEEMKRLNVNGPALPQIIDAIYDKAIVDRYSVKQGSYCKKPPVSGGSSSPWVFANNLFVVCVIKTPENLNDGDLLFTELEKALCEWAPDFMKTSVAYARGEFARGGFGHEQQSLNDPLLQAGWLYHAWAGDSEEQEVRLRVLFERIIRTYAGHVLDKVIAYGKKSLPQWSKPAATPETLAAAIRAFFPAGNAPTDVEVLHALNEYLATEELPKYLETGSIFTRKEDGITKGFVYICVPPGCDLVPRTPRGGSWERQIDPNRPIIAMRCTLEDATKENLVVAEQCRCIYLTLNGKRKTLRIVNDLSRIPALEWFIAVESARIAADGSFSAWAFNRKPEEADDRSKPIAPVVDTMTVLAQLRAIYANRILQHAGQHMSRIGVDFVQHPGAGEQI